MFSVSKCHRQTRRICGWVMELVDGHESSLALNSGCKLQVRAGVLFDFRRALVDCAFLTKSIWENSLFSPQSLEYSMA